MLLPQRRLRLHYDDIGPAQAPVVLMLNSLVADCGMWEEQVIPLLQAGYRVLRLDQWGHGGSDDLAGPYDMSMLAEDACALLDRLEIIDAHVLGSSLGGMIGQSLAITFPNRVRSLMVSGTLPRSPVAAAEMWAERVRLVSDDGSAAPLADSIMARWFDAAFKDARPVRWKQLRDTLALTRAEGFNGCASAILDFDFTPALPALKVPTLVVCGADDVSTPESENRLLASLIPGGRYEAIPNGRHLANVDQPERFNAQLLAWLNATKAR